MSIRVMSQVWELDLPDSEKLVALALADWSNDDGVSWPSVAQIAHKCSKGTRTIQATLKRLEARGVLSRVDKPGRGSVWTLTPAKSAPLQHLHPPPQRLHPIRQIYPILLRRLRLLRRRARRSPTSSNHSDCPMTGNPFGSVMARSPVRSSTAGASIGRGPRWKASGAGPRTPTTATERGGNWIGKPLGTNG